MKGLTAIVSDMPHQIKEKVNKEIELTRELAKLGCKGKSGLSYDYCEAKIFIENNPYIVQGMVAGNWSGAIEKWKEVV
jgi:hypothetical protein